MLKNNIIYLIFFIILFFYKNVYAEKLPFVIDGKSNFEIISEGINIVHDAGDILLKYYKQDPKYFAKEDSSPVTIADIESNKYITTRLKELTANIKIISEESSNNSISGDIFWLVDPMDGTKSFINGTDQFTVNIALIKNNRPIIGIIHIPVLDKTYFTGPDGFAYLLDSTNNFKRINTRKSANKIVVVGSKSHRSVNDESYIKKFNEKEFISAHSSIKFCLIAEGVADIYPRFGPTMEWDIAAGQAILLAAGGRVIDAFNGNDFIYNKPEFRNGAFIAYGGVDKQPPLASK